MNAALSVLDESMYIYRNLTNASNVAAVAGKSSMNKFYTYLNNIVALSVTGRRAVNHFYLAAVGSGLFVKL